MIARIGTPYLLNCFHRLLWYSLVITSLWVEELSEVKYKKQVPARETS